MAVDVASSIEIQCPRAEVASFAADPDNATSWYENIKAVEWRTPPPLAVGSQIAFVAQFLGRRLEYTYVVQEHVPGERFAMSTCSSAADAGPPRQDLRGSQGVRAPTDPRRSWTAGRPGSPQRPRALEPPCAALAHWTPQAPVHVGTTRRPGGHLSRGAPP